MGHVRHELIQLGRGGRWFNSVVVNREGIGILGRGQTWHSRLDVALRQRRRLRRDRGRLFSEVHGALGVLSALAVKRSRMRGLGNVIER